VSIKSTRGRYAPQNMARAQISSGRYPCYQRSPHRGLLRSVKNFQSFAVICHKPHMASSICLRATIFQKPRVDFVDILYCSCPESNSVTVAILTAPSQLLMSGRSFINNFIGYVAVFRAALL
jgi:hypothetical protein